MRLIFLSLIILCLSACGDHRLDPPVIEKSKLLQPKHEPQKGLNQAYADRLTEMCYAKVRNSVGSTGYRGLVWLRCMEENVMPIEQRLKPVQSRRIRQIYAGLKEDMNAVYEGRTTLPRLNARWSKAQKAIGLEDIRQYRYRLAASL